MAEGKIDSLMQAQLKRDEFLVRDLARRLGANYAFEPSVQNVMAMHGVDRVDVAECLAGSVVRELFPMFGTLRHRVEPEEFYERIASMTLCVHPDSQTIEVIVLRLKEAKS